MFSAGDNLQNYIKTSVNNADYSGKITLLYEERSNENEENCKKIPFAAVSGVCIVYSLRFPGKRNFHDLSGMRRKQH